MDSPLSRGTRQILESLGRAGVTSLPKAVAATAAPCPQALTPGQPLAAREAAREADGDVSALEREIEEMRAAAVRGDWRSQLAHDLAFHRAVVELAANEALQQCWLVLGVEVSPAERGYQVAINAGCFNRKH